MPNRLVLATRCAAVVCAVAVAVAFWQQADTYSFEQDSTVDKVAGVVFVTCIGAAPYMLSLAIAALLRGVRWAQVLLLTVMVGGAAWTVQVARQPIPPQGRDGIVFVAMPMALCIVFVAVCGLGLAVNSARNSRDALSARLIQPPPRREM